MIPEDVLRHFYSATPSQFVESISVTGAYINAGALHVTASAPLVVGKSCYVGKANLLNPISVVGSLASGWMITTDYAHKLTLPTTFDTTCAANFIALDIPNAHQVFTRGEQPSGHLLEPVDFGLCEVLSNDGSEIRFKLPDGYFYNAAVSIASVASRVNVAIVPDAQRAKQVYVEGSKQLWAFIIFGDRNSLPDSNQQAGVINESKGGNAQVLVSTDFTILVVWPSQSAQESARKQLNEAYGAVYSALNRLFFGKRFSDYRTVPVGNGIAEIKTMPHYAHAYEFQSIERIDFERDGANSATFNEPVRFVDGRLLVDCGQTEPQEIQFNVEFP